MIVELTFCHANMIEYGTSPRYGCLTDQGRLLREFLLSKTEEQLIELVCGDKKDRTYCSPHSCNCGPAGYVPGKKCPNPFWGGR